MRTRSSLMLVLSLVAGAGGCDEASKVNDAAKQATEAAQKAADRTQKAVDDASKRIDDASKTASDAVDSTKSAIDAAQDATARTWAGLTNTGELSNSALAWMKSTAEDTDMRAIVAKGVQVAPVAFEIGKTINSAVDSETAIEPIYQELGDRDPAEVDKAIASMPRVEVVDGLKVGFSQLNRLDAGSSVDERAYLVTWRHEKHLIGLVYRTKRTIDLEMLVKEAPRLVALVRTAVHTDPAP